MRIVHIPSNTYTIFEIVGVANKVKQFTLEKLMIYVCAAAAATAFSAFALHFTHIIEILNTFQRVFLQF